MNLQGREPNGIVNAGKEYDELRDRIIVGLLKLRDPETGENVVSHVIKKEDVYSGKYLFDVPDLLIQWKDNKYIHRPSHSSRNEEPIQILNAKELEEAEMTSRPSGIHVPEGIFMVKGKGFRKGAEIPPYNICDIAPTILYLYDLPVPADMDGAVIESAFQRDFLSKRPTKISEDETIEVKAESDIYSAPEEAEISKRLKGLGYL